MASHTKEEKTKVIATLVEKVRRDSPEGGFIKFGKETGLWFPLSKDRARDKVGHAIRRVIGREKKKSIEFSNQNPQKDEGYELRGFSRTGVTNASLMLSNRQPDQLIEPTAFPNVPLSFHPYGSMDINQPIASDRYTGASIGESDQPTFHSYPLTGSPNALEIKADSIKQLDEKSELVKVISTTIPNPLTGSSNALEIIADSNKQLNEKSDLAKFFSTTIPNYDNCNQILPLDEFTTDFYIGFSDISPIDEDTLDQLF
jgi:hypothetical protein